MKSLKIAVLALLTTALVVPPALAQTPSYGSPVLQRPTFSSGATFTYPQTGAGDAACLVGSATKTVRITKIRVSGTDATAQSAVMNLVKRTTANSGGTSTQPSVGSFDSALNNGGATAVVNAYTAVPTPGTGVTIGSDVVNLLATTTATTVYERAFNPQNQLNQQLTLRGVAQAACVSFPNALSTAAASLSVTFEWTEQ